MRKGEAPVGHLSRRAWTVGVSWIAVTAFTIVTGCSTGSGGDGTSTVHMTNSDTLGWAPEWVADSEKLWKKNNLDVQIVINKGDAQTIPAIASGGADFGVATIPAILKAIHLGEPIVMVAAVNSEVSQQFAMSQDFARRAGITPDMSFSDKMRRVAAMKNVKVGTLDIGGGLQLTFDGLAKEYGMVINDNYSVSAVAPYSSLLLALKRGQVDIGLFGPPYGQQAVIDGYGVMLADIAAGQIPGVKSVLFGAMVTNKKFAQQNPRVVQSVRRALDDAMTEIHASPDKARVAVKARFPSFSDPVLQTLFQNDSAQFAQHADITEQQFNSGRDFTAKYVFPQVAGVNYADAVWRQPAS